MNKIIHTLHTYTNKMGLSYETKLLILSFVVGIIGGYGAILFRFMIKGFHYAFTHETDALFGFMGHGYVILIPAIGGLLVGVITTFFADEAKGHGVPEVMNAVLLKGGKIRPKVSVAKILASAICIGSGGSAGREGPIVQIGSAFASTLGQVLRLSDSMIKRLVAAGAAAGISATFNAPIGGVIFGLEVILGEYTATNFGTLVIAAVTAQFITRIHLGNIHDFDLPQFTVVSPVEMVFYGILGVLSAFVAVAFIKMLYKSEDLFNHIPHVPSWMLPAIGGLGVGLIGFFFPQVLGVGYDVMTSAIIGQYSVGLVLALVVIKLISTSLTLGSGGSGGIFSPSLFMGAMLGAGMGMLLHQWFPTMTATPGAYAIVGMAAVFAAGTRAPITAVLILFEMTNTYEIILPLMVAVVIATYCAAKLKRDTLYTEKLSRRGINVFALKERNNLDYMKVSDIMSSNGEIISNRYNFSKMLDLIRNSSHSCFISVDDDGKLAGIVSLKDLRDAVFEKGMDHVILAQDLATKDVLTVRPSDTLNDALKKFGTRDVELLPVVDSTAGGKVLGCVSRKNVISLYQDRVLNMRGKSIL